MRYGFTPVGDAMHAVPERGDGTALCGAEDVTVVEGLRPAGNLCLNCDMRWRERGRQTKKRQPRDSALYVPRYTFEHWDPA